MSAEDAVDFAVVAYREEGRWQVRELDVAVAVELDDLLDELQRWPGDFGALGLVSVDDEYLILARVAGDEISLLLSDVTAALDSPLAREVLEELELPVPDDDEDQEPAGDLAIAADLGLSAIDMAAMLDDLDLYPDEVLSDIARRLGFGPQFDDLVGTAVS